MEEGGKGTERIIDSLSFSFLSSGFKKVRRLLAASQEPKFAFVVHFAW